MTGPRRTRDTIIQIYSDSNNLWKQVTYGHQPTLSVVAHKVEGSFTYTAGDIHPNGRM